MIKKTEGRILWVRYDAHAAFFTGLKLSMIGELAHRRLCDTYWSQGDWPTANPEGAAAIARVPLDSWPQVLKELAVVGWRVRSEQLFCPSAQVPLREARKYLKLRRSLGRVGGQTRAKNAAASSAQAKLKLSASSPQAKPAVSSSSAQGSTR